MEDLKYFLDAEGNAIFSFSHSKDGIGFDYWDDFLIVARVIKTHFSPDEIQYSGVTEIRGYFVKSGFRVEMVCDTMVGVYFAIPKEKITDKTLDETYQLLNAIWHKSLESKMNHEFDF